MSKKMIAAATAAALLTLGAGGTAIAAQQDTTQATGGQQQGQQAEERDPNIKGTIPAPAEQGEQDEAAESKQFEGLAKIDQKAAEEAALAAVPGTVKDIQLEDENGFVVYGVEVQASDGTLQEVIVDAGSGEVLVQEKADNEANEGPEGSEANEGPEAGEATR